jgi:hypothetical protein
MGPACVVTDAGTHADARLSTVGRRYYALARESCPAVAR